MSRSLSTSSKLAKSLNWTLNGTTVNVDWAKELTEKAVDMVPKLKAKVVNGVIDCNGNPNPSKEGVIHARGQLGVKTVVGKQRVTSFHAYRNGRVKFSGNEFGEVLVEGYPKPDDEQSASSATPTQSPEVSALKPEKVWDEELKQFKFWDGKQWILQ